MTCDRLRGWQTFAPRGHRPAATSPKAILSPPIPATARVAEHVKMVPINITDYSVLVSSHHDPADNREQPRVPFCSLLFMMNTNGRILCIVLFVSMLSIRVLGLAAAIDDNAITAEDSPVTIAVLANDSVSGLISVSITSAPSFGAAVVNPDNTITYEPVANFNGADTFTYRVVDGGGTSTAQVTVTVASVNDSPVLVDNLFATEADTPVTITLQATDPELDTFYPEDDLLTFAIVAEPSHGTLDGVWHRLPYLRDTTHRHRDARVYTSHRLLRR